MTSTSAKLLIFAASCLLVAETHAQAFNIDFGGDPAVPSAAYGAASSQTGAWNPGVLSLSTPLFGLDGLPTLATIGGTSSGGGLGLVVPNASADEQTFMGDFDGFSRNAGGYRIRNVTPGTYDIYVYSWRGADDKGTPGIVVSTTTQQVGLSVSSGSPWPGGQVLGVTFGIARITLQPDQLGFAITGFAGGEGTAPINGIQIVPVPAPGAALLAPLAGFSLARRRRA